MATTLQRYYRLIEASVLEYIKSDVLGINYIEQLTNETLTYNRPTARYLVGNTTMEPDPISKGRGWVYFDQTTDSNGNVSSSNSTEQTARVVVRDSSNSTVIASSNYTVNYLKGGLQSVNSGVTPAYIDYFFNVVSVVLGWPDGDTMPPLPVVALVTLDTGPKGFQLGGGKQINRNFALEVFAEDAAQLEDLNEMLVDGLYEKQINLINFSASGTPLNFDGSFNSSYTRALVSGVSKIEFFQPTVTHSGERSTWSDANRFRSRIVVRAEVFVGV